MSSDPHTPEVTSKIKRTKPTSPLPSYELLMRERRVQNTLTNHQQDCNDKSKSENKNENPGNILPIILQKSSGCLPSDSPSSYQANESFNNSFYEKKLEFDRAVYNNSKPKLPYKQTISSSNSPFLSAASVQHIPNGKVSPTKSSPIFPVLQPQMTSSAAARDSRYLSGNNTPTFSKWFISHIDMIFLFCKYSVKLTDGRIILCKICV